MGNFSKFSQVKRIVHKILKKHNTAQSVMREKKLLIKINTILLLR